MCDSFSQSKTVYLAHMFEPKTKSANFAKRIQMHFEYHSIFMNIAFVCITILIVRYTYVSGSFSQCKTVYLAHMYEPKPESDNFVRIIKIYFECNSLWANSFLISINLKKQSTPEVFLKKRCSENMQQMHRRTPMPKCAGLLL